MGPRPTIRPAIRRAARRAAIAAGAAALLVSSAACSAGNGQTSIAFITKDSVNPFFITMQDGAKAEAAKLGIGVTLGAGAPDGDTDGQITAIENAIARGDTGIVIDPTSTAVNDALQKARDAGLHVIAVDSPPDPADVVDRTFATDNRQAGKLIGEWTAAQLNGGKATIALLDLFNDKLVPVDFERDQGFLAGLGVDVADPDKTGDEAPSGRYTGGQGGDYEIVCQEPTLGATDGGRSAMERCLSGHPEINVVYTINEPAAVGAAAALKAAGNTATLVSIDGGCAGVESVRTGVIGATAQQYPLKMAEMGVQAVRTAVDGGQLPPNSDGLDFYDTGVELVTDRAVDGVQSIDATQGSQRCWG